MSDSVAVAQLVLTPEIEKRVLHLILTDPIFAPKWFGRLKPEHFQHEWSSRVFESINGFYKIYKALPSAGDLYQAIYSNGRNTDAISEILDYTQSVVTTADASVQGSNLQFLKDIILKHMLKHDYEEWILQAAENVRDQEYNTIETSLAQLKQRHGEIPLPQPYSSESVVERVRKEQARAKTVQSPWPTLNMNHGGGFEPGSVVAIMGPSGCHRKGQLIMLADGSLKPVEDIVVGDQLMGNGDIKTVLQLCRGRGPMYQIDPIKGDSWVVNDQHILTLVRIDGRSTMCGELVDLTVEEYLTKSKTFKSVHKLVRASDVIFADTTADYDLPMNPYLLGVLLGDGSWASNTAYIHKPDLELQEAIGELVGTHGCRVSRLQNEKGFTLPKIERAGGPNPIRTLLDDLGLDGTTSGTKFIPKPYLTASLSARRKLLAGLLDTDGSNQNGMADYISKSKVLADGVVFIARSLGFYARVQECRKSCQNGFVGTYYRVGISGDLSTLPMKIPRKQFHQRKQIKDVLHTGFSVTPVGTEDFYGFTLTGDGRYLLDDFTVTHNSGKSIALCNVGAHFAKTGKTVYHFTFELSRQDTQKRYDSVLSGVTQKERLVNPQLVDNAINNLKLGAIFVVEAPTGQCNMNMVSAVLNEHKLVHGNFPDVVILDYLTIMTPNNPDIVDMKKDYSKLKVIAEEARAMAMELQIPVITAFQSNRGSIDKNTIQKQDVADSFAVIHVLDLVLSINQTENEKRAGQMRLYVAKCRNYMDNYTILAKVDYDRLTIYEDSTLTKSYNAQIERQRVDGLQPQSAISGVGKPNRPWDPSTMDSFTVIGTAAIGVTPLTPREIDGPPLSDRNDLDLLPPPPKMPT